MTKRNIKQIAVATGPDGSPTIIAVDDDGTAWRRHLFGTGVWAPLPALPDKPADGEFKEITDRDYLICGLERISALEETVADLEETVNCLIDRADDDEELTMAIPDEITDAHLGMALSIKCRETSHETIRALIGHYVSAGRSYCEIPQSDRSQFLADLDNLPADRRDTPKRRRIT